MSTHLTNKEIDKLVSGLASERDVKTAREHLNSCPGCRSVVDALSSVLAKQPSDSVPGEHVREAVISEWYRLHNETVEKRESARPGRKKFIGFAVAASVMIALGSYILLSTVKHYGTYPLIISSAAGEVIINDSMPGVNTPVKTGDVILTGEESSGVLSSDGYNVYIGRSSSLRVTENSKRNGIFFSLNEGSVISKSSGSLLYRFECGKYKIVPAGTEFMLHFTKDKLSLAVTQGAVAVTGPELKIEISAGMKWSSENSGAVESIDAETSALINSVNAGVWPVRAPLHKEGEYQMKDAPAEISGNDGVKNSGDSGVEKNNLPDDKKEKLEKKKLKGELGDEMKEIKKELRMEQRKELKKEQRREKSSRNKG